MSEKIPIESVITVTDYATRHGISERQVIKRITNGELFGYNAKGTWYVRIVTNPQLSKDALNSIPIVEIPAVPITVPEYSQRTGIPIPNILGSIADGTTPGFHTNGIWYVGISKQINVSKSCHAYFWLQLLVGVLLLVSTAVALWWLTPGDNPQPELASLSIEVRVNDRVGMPHPVVGEPFFLLAKDLEDIAIDYVKDVSTPNYASKNTKTDTMPKWVAMLAGSTALRSLLFDVSSRLNRVSVWEFRQNFEQSKVLWLNHVTQSAVTNKSGQASFNSLPVREYWVMGWTETGTGFGFWKHWVSLKSGNNKLLLQPGNAVYFR